MTYDDDARHERLMELVAEAMENEPPGPSDAVHDAAVTAAFQLRVADGILADLVNDSLAAGAGAGVRAAGDDDRTVAFAGRGVTIEVHFLAGTDTVVGHVTPAGPDAVEVETPARRTTVAVDELGRFSSTVTAPFVRFRLAPPTAGPEIVTRWIVR